MKTTGDLAAFLREYGLRMSMLYTGHKFLVVIARDNFAWITKESDDLDAVMDDAIKEARKQLS